MFPTRLHQLWREDQAAVAGWLMLNQPLVAEAVARAGFDAVVIDMQHGLSRDDDLVGLLQAIGQTPATPLVRVPANEAAVIGRALDAGAAGVIVPLVSTPEEAARAVAACRYPPQGTRSYGPVRASLLADGAGGYGGGAAYTDHANTHVICLVMIETAAGLANVDAICATPGLDGVFIGPADLGLALGLPAQLDQSAPAHTAAVAAIVAACRQHGRVAGLFCNSPAFAAEKVRVGLRLVTLETDLAALTRAHRERLQAFRES
jgi:4-hydroxy-2-oxoheptanedioate aldolase